MVSIKDIARTCGVSHTTVSNALGNRDIAIRPDTRERILRVAAEMGYQPNHLARSLVRGKTNAIGLMIAGLENPLFVAILETAERLALEAGYEVMLHVTPSVGGTYYDHTKLSKWAVDGVLMWGNADHHLETYLGAQGRETPVVYLGYPRGDGNASVSFDLFGGGRQAAEHVVERGYRNIAFLSPYYGPNSWQDLRYLAYREVCAEAGLSHRDIETGRTSTRAAGFEAGLAIAAEPAPTRPDAILCNNDVIALGAYHGLRRCGLRIPEDIAIAGFDGIEESRYLDVPLTTVHCPVDQLCKSALGILMQRIDGKAEPSTDIIIPTQLQRGGTT